MEDTRATGLEPATFDVTGQYSNQLSYVLKMHVGRKSYA